LGLAIFLSMNVMMFTMALWTQEMHTADAAREPLAAGLADLFRYLCLVLSLPVLWLLGVPMLEQAYRGRTAQATTDVLIVVGVAAAFVYSVVSVVRGQGHIYFEVGCAVLVMMTLGRWIEATGKLKTTAALDALERLLPAEVRVKTAGGSAFNWRPLDQVSVGDHVLVSAGERIPFDGWLRTGRALVDQQVLTGESIPVFKEPGDRLYSGTLNSDGELTVEVTAAADQGVWSQLLALVRAGQARQSRDQRLAERVARWFLPGVVAVAGGALVYHGARDTWQTAIFSALAVLLIACPCALGLATPMAMCAAFGEASRRQILIRGGDILERLATVGAIAFDKTGTLTTGLPTLRAILVASGEDEQKIRSLAGQLSANSGHPFARSIARAADAGAEHKPTIGEVRTRAGCGLEAEQTGHEGLLYLGSLSWMRELQMVLPVEIENQLQPYLQRGESVSALAWQGQVRAAFVLHDHLRDDARAAVAACRELGLHVEALTGDHRARAQALERELETAVRGELTPADKVAAIEALRKSYAGVVMVGDGLNDSPALAMADVGIALACGADLARESAGVCLLGNDLRQIAWTVSLARRTVRIVRQNLFWAFAYNVVGIGLAASGRLNPAFAAFAMVASSGLVIVNSLRIRGGEEVRKSGPASIPVEVRPSSRRIPQPGACA
jgi:heavy metal translocating P-type ATPase